MAKFRVMVRTWEFLSTLNLVKTHPPLGQIYTKNYQISANLVLLWKMEDCALPFRRGGESVWTVEFRFLSFCYYYCCRRCRGGIVDLCEIWESWTWQRSRVDPAPLVSTEPKRRSLGTVVALRDRGRKLYPDPGARTGTSEAEANPSNSRGSMDYLWQNRKFKKKLSLLNFTEKYFMTKETNVQIRRKA